MKLLWILFIALPSFFFAQEKTEVLAMYAVTDETKWHADFIGHVYLAENGILTKFDIQGNKLFSQSIKSMGAITQISSINTMRMLVFSEQQQTFLLIDNTLTEANNTYDLSELGFVSAQLMAVSSQPNKFWVYDQAASKLTLLDLSRTNQQQEISNIRGVLKSAEIVWMKEDNNQLHLLDKSGQLFVFDIYGTLQETMQFPEKSTIDICNKEIFVLNNGQIFHHNKETNLLDLVDLPFEGVQEFLWLDNYFYLRTHTELIKFKFLAK